MCGTKSGRTVYAQAEPAAEASGFAYIANDLQDELARLERMGISTSGDGEVLGDARVRSLGRELREQRRSVLQQTRKKKGPVAGALKIVAKCPWIPERFRAGR